MGNTITFYIDGIADEGHGFDRTIIDSNEELLIGTKRSNTWDTFFLGKIDELGLYNRTLSEDEIKAMMNARIASVKGRAQRSDKITDR